MSEVATHQEPVWREHSDFIIVADISNYSAAASREQLWARKLSASTFEVCCIPFFVYDLALGDVVATMSERDHVLSQVVRPSGRFVFRAWLASAGPWRSTILERLGSLGCLLEWSSMDLVAVDSPDLEQAILVGDFLQAQEDAGRLVFETGRSR